MQLPLTKRQREIFDWLTAQIAANGYAPSLEEIGRHFELSSLATVWKHVEVLREKGWISRRWGCSRALEILPPPDCCPTCGRRLEPPTPEAKDSAAA